ERQERTMLGKLPLLRPVRGEPHGSAGVPAAGRGGDCKTGQAECGAGNSALFHGHLGPPPDGPLGGAGVPGRGSVEERKQPVGLLGEAQYRRLKPAGVTRVHNNLETSRRNFPNIYTTHTFADKLRAIRAAQSAGLFVCSGGIMGLGETIEDRIDMALTIRELEIKSVPVNMLNPIPGTPLGENEPLSAEDMCRIVAVYRFLLPDAAIRLAGGRGLLADKGRSCFMSGANAAISGDMLTTAGITTEADKQMFKELGYEARRLGEVRCG